MGSLQRSPDPIIGGEVPLLHFRDQTVNLVNIFYGSANVVARSL